MIIPQHSHRLTLSRNKSIFGPHRTILISVEAGKSAVPERNSPARHAGSETQRSLIYPHAETKAALTDDAAPAKFA